jgi:ABC-2 type transport system ATP-binding protein
MTATAIEATGLGLAYGRRGRRALHDCSFRIPAGRVCALAGPNGAGKSTLLALAAGLLRPVSGKSSAAHPPTYANASRTSPRRSRCIRS